MEAAPDPASDEELVARMAARDERALGEFYRRYYEEILDGVRARVGNRDTASDLAQETFIRAYRGAKTYRGEGAARAWLHTIARNVTASHLRAKSRHRIVELEKVAETELVDADADTRHRLLADLRALSELLELLKPDYRRVMELYLEEKSAAEIAALEKISVQLVGSRLANAKAFLKAEVERREKRGKRGLSSAVVAVLLGPDLWAGGSADGVELMPKTSARFAAAGVIALVFLTLALATRSCRPAEETGWNADRTDHDRPPLTTDELEPDAGPGTDGSVSPLRPGSSVSRESSALTTTHEPMVSWASLDGRRGVGPAGWIVAPPDERVAQVPWLLRVTSHGFTFSHQRLEFAINAPSELRFGMGRSAPIATEFGGPATCSSATTCVGSHQGRIGVGTCEVDVLCVPDGSDREVSYHEEFLSAGALVDHDILALASWRRSPEGEPWRQIWTVSWMTPERAADTSACAPIGSSAPLTMREAAEVVCPIAPRTRACALLSVALDLEAAFPTTTHYTTPLEWSCPEGVAPPPPVVER